MQNTNYLVCKMSVFNSVKDEEAFFEWIDRIDCVKRYRGVGEVLYVFLKNKELLEHDLVDLLGIFYRYKLDMKQFAKFLNEQNKPWFFDNKIAYWHRRVFGKI
jgi:hypothetical protein